MRAATPPAAPSANLRPVYVHAVGVISPLGPTWPATLQRLRASDSAIQPVTSFDVAGFPCQAAAQVPTAWLPDGEDRRWLLARCAAQEALHAAPNTWRAHPPHRRGVWIGAESGRASLHTVLAFSQAAGGGKTFEHQQFGQRARALAHTFDAVGVSPATVAAKLSGLWSAQGPCQTMSLACSSSAAAIIEAARALQLGEADVALCGGVGADVDPLMLAGFGLLGALSPSGRSCPFDARRDGFVVGEGAAMALLSTSPKGALAKILGMGRTLDAHHLVQPHPQGDGAQRAMRQALREANLATVDVIQAHGTSTKLNDAIEAAALRAVFGDSLSRAHVSSVKGALGHWVAGAGALGFVCALEAVCGGVALPTAGLLTPDADCDLPHVIGQAIARPVKAALVNAFAFGGANSTLILGQV
jgi:3-oxoacyl-[acyl-carrier-protein] synthase II